MRVDEDADTDQTARRVLRELGFEPAHLEQACTESGRARSARLVPSVVYLALHAADALQPLADDGRITLHDIEALPALAFDHNRLIALAAQRCAKSAYTSIVAHLLHDEFTIPQVQAAFEAVTGHRMNAANFRRKILETGALRETRIVPAAYRPAGYRLAEPLTDFGQNLAR